MKKYFHLSLIFLMFLPAVKAQDAFYKHLEGKVGSNINVVMDLVASKEKLRGYYYYFFDDHSGDASWTHFGKSMPVTGRIHTDGTLEFSEFDPEVKGAVYSGILKDSLLSGTWTSADGKKQLPFEAVEKYPSGTLAFRAIYLKEEIPLFEKTKNSPVASLELSLLLPGGPSDAGVSNAVTRLVYADFFGKYDSLATAENLIDETKRQYVANYRNSNADIYQEGAQSFNWNKIKEVRILHNEHDLLSLEFHDYGFTGGAHGLTVSKFRVLDLADGHLVGLDEIFRDDYTNDLRDIINTSARKLYGLERGQSLREAGFYNDFIDPSDNFYITRDGIGFFYNQYEVAPYAMGQVNVFVNYNELMRILRTNGPAERLIRK